AHVARLQPLGVFADLDDLARDLMAQHARVGEERLPAAEGVQVAAAHADPAHADERLARPGGRLRRLAQLQSKRLCQCHSAHPRPPGGCELSVIMQDSGSITVAVWRIKKRKVE